MASPARAQTNPDNQVVAALFQAIEHNDTNGCQQLLAEHTNLLADSFYQRFYFRRYPLLQAASQGRTTLVELLLKGGADPNVWGDTTMSANAQMTALEEAARGGHPEVCELLLKAGANPAYQAFWGTPRCILP
jgi:ankyrin repeat protein